MATDNKTSLLTDSLLPDYLETEGPQLQAFVRAYYEWMETSGQMTDRSKNILDYQDLDKTTDEFYEYFKREILSLFPKNILSDKAITYKRIKDLYRSKGSEESFKLLFRILYDEDIDFYYPSQDILRASDGRWIQEQSIRLTKPILGDPTLLSGTMTGRTSGATAHIERVTNILVDGIDVFEVFVTSIEGTFLDGEEIFNIEDNIRGIVISKEGSLQRVIVIDGGSGHQRNDLVTITSLSGSGGRGKISLTDGGKIVSLAVTNAGSSFVRTDSLNIENTSRTAVNAIAAPLLTAPIEYTGRYSDVRGFLSWSNKIQDSRYYQEYSYVLRSSQVLNTYREIVKDIVHPAGMRLFGDVLITVNIDQTVNIERENIMYQSISSDAAINIPLVVSANIDQYLKSQDPTYLAAVNGWPELEIGTVPAVIDPTIPDTGVGYQVEIELIAAQTSALLDNDSIIVLKLTRIIEDITVNRTAAALDLTIAQGDEETWFYDQVALEVNADIPLNAVLIQALSVVGIHRLIPTIGIRPGIASNEAFGDFTVEFEPLDQPAITTTLNIGAVSVEPQIDPLSVASAEAFSTDFRHYMQASGLASTRYINANTINDISDTPILDVADVPLLGADTTRVIEGNVDALFNIEANVNSLFLIRDSGTNIYGALDPDSHTFDSNTIIATANVGVFTNADIAFSPMNVFEVIINTSITNTTIGAVTISITGTNSFDSANTTFDSSLTFDRITQ